ncbi:hypothetical protein ACFL6S_14535 [Candidatus Poribacteria bacterium]
MSLFEPIANQPPSYLGGNDRGNFSEDLPQMPTESELTEISDLPSFKQQDLKTTTDLPVPKIRIKEMMKEYGVCVVVDTISVNHTKA